MGLPVSIVLCHTNHLHVLPHCIHKPPLQYFLPGGSILGILLLTNPGSFLSLCLHILSPSSITTFLFYSTCTVLIKYSFLIFSILNNPNHTFNYLTPSPVSLSAPLPLDIPFHLCKYLSSTNHYCNSPSLTPPCLYFLPNHYYTINYFERLSPSI